MKVLSQEDVLALNRVQRQELLDSLESRIGELDYTCPVESVEYYKLVENAEMIISKILYNEY
jgi:hypothetical protein